MTAEQGRGPADLGESTMPDTEERDPSTRHGETASPGDLDTTAESDDEGIGEKIKDAVGNAIGKAKGMLSRDN